jgi:hypothetical protein
MGGDDGDEAPQPRRCNGATAWRDTGGGALRAGGCSMRLRAGMTRTELCIFGRISGSMRARMRIGAMFVLRQRLWLGNGGGCLLLALGRLQNRELASGALRCASACREPAARFCIEGIRPEAWVLIG